MNDKNHAESFSQRLNSVLDDYGFSPKGSGRQTKLARLISRRHDLKPITQKGVRKWLEGEGMPRKSYLVFLADHFQCDPSWLEYGNTNPYSDQINESDFDLIKRIHNLPEDKIKELSNYLNFLENEYNTNLNEESKTE